ncbi:hypothetical protein ORS3428_28805 [Mesorhizobium sp. ORS 3428]|nr:hypothetical protein ORS3428_28805 [Mesorhizobium sp. ORS 3428]
MNGSVPGWTLQFKAQKLCQLKQAVSVQYVGFHARFRLFVTSHFCRTCDLKARSALEGSATLAERQLMVAEIGRGLPKRIVP